MRRHAVACLPAIHLLVERKLVRRLQVEAADLDIDLADMALCVELQDRTGILFAAILIVTAIALIGTVVVREIVLELMLAVQRPLVVDAVVDKEVHPDRLHIDSLEILEVLLIPAEAAIAVDVDGRLIRLLLDLAHALIEAVELRVEAFLELLRLVELLLQLAAQLLQRLLRHRLIRGICLDSWCAVLPELHCSISGRLCADRTTGSEHQSRNQTTSQ